uniref:Uncharacterized protein n=1 Tax=viral metagenome TaxID=1070528 RepID=A0A6H2A5R2_9ZZZZ
MSDELKSIQSLFKEYIVRRRNGQCQVLIPLRELDSLCLKIEKLLLKENYLLTKKKQFTKDEIKLIRKMACLIKDLKRILVEIGF